MHKVAVAAAWITMGVFTVTGSRPASADVLVNISKSSQRMSVLVDGSARYNWAVSTGAKRYTTPSGVYKPEWLARKWRSRKYGNAPMPHSIFFHDGYAIHGTTEIARLGKIASHGCVRLHPDNAARLYQLVEKQMKNTRVVVSEDAIEAPGEAPKKKPNRYISENGADEKPTVASKAPLQTVALVPESVPSAKPRAAEPAVSTEIARPKPARTQKTARAYGGGFHW